MKKLTILIMLISIIGLYSQQSGKMYIWQGGTIQDTVQVTNDLKLTFKTGGAIPTSGLIAYYPFNGNTNDESGNGNNCTPSNCTLTTDRFGNANSAYLFNSSNSVISRSSIGSMFSISNVTLSAWVKAYKYTKNNPRIVCVGNTTYTNNNYSICWHDTVHSTVNPSSYLFYADGVGQVYSNNKIIGDSTWHHIAVTYDQSYVKFYIDGLLDNTVALSGNLLPIAADGILRIGNNWNNNDPFSGVIDEICIYNRALSQAEIQLLYGSIGK